MSAKLTPPVCISPRGNSLTFHPLSVAVFYEPNLSFWVNPLFFPSADIIYGLAPQVATCTTHLGMEGQTVGRGRGRGLAALSLGERAGCSLNTNIIPPQLRLTAT